VPPVDEMALIDTDDDEIAPAPEVGRCLRKKTMKTVVPSVDEMALIDMDDDRMAPTPEVGHRLCKKTTVGGPAAGAVAHASSDSTTSSHMHDIQMTSTSAPMMRKSKEMLESLLQFHVVLYLTMGYQYQSLLLYRAVVKT